jgi:transposase
MDLLARGLTGREVAERVGVDQSTVWRWRKALREHGDEGITTKPIPGRPPALSQEQRDKLIGMLLRGARAHGWSTDLWTTQRIADLIERHFGVRHHRDHVGRMLHQMGLSWQKPIRRASQRDEERIARWVAEDAPRIKKKPRR